MQTYSEYQPTGFDRRGAFLHDQGKWLVAPVGLNRDSGELEQSNFAVAIKMLGGESDQVQIHRFGHWACGWFEIIIVDPDSDKVSILTDMENSLSDYPVLDEEDYSQREYDSINECWDDMGLSERIEQLQSAGGSIFAARRDSPWDIDIDSGDWPYELIRG